MSDVNLKWQVFNVSHPHFTVAVSATCDMPQDDGNDNPWTNARMSLTISKTVNPAGQSPNGWELRIFNVRTKALQVCPGYPNPEAAAQTAVNILQKKPRQAAETRTRQPAERTTQAQALEQAETDAERFVSSQNARIPQPGQPDPNRDRTAPPPELQVLPPLEITRLHQDRTAPPPEIQALPPLEVTPLHKS